MRELADFYRQFGFNIIPLGTDKRPVIVGAHHITGQALRFKWRDWERTPQSNLWYKSIRSKPFWKEAGGVATTLGVGSGGLVNIDFDSQRKYDRQALPIGRDVIDGFVAEIGLADDYAWISTTPTGGWHVWVLCPDLMLEKASISRPGSDGIVHHVEFRFTGSYTVLPGSRHPDHDERYAFAGERPTTPPQVISPEVLLAAYDAITTTDEPSAAQTKHRPTSTPSGGDTPYALKALEDEIALVERSAEGSRNDELNRAAFRVGQLTPHELSEETAYQSLLDAAMGSGLGEGESIATIRSGLSSGAAEPRYPEPTVHSTNGHGYAHGFSRETPETWGEDHNVLPTINVQNRQLRDVRHDALQALLRKNAQKPTHPHLFVRGGTLARIARDENSLYAAQVMDTPSMAGLMADCADWVRIGSKGKVTHVDPPTGVVRDVLALGEWRDFPALAGIVQSPTFGDDGELHDEPGYAQHTRLYYANYVHHDTMDALSARQLILEDLLGDFPFVDDASRAHAVALLLLPFIRPMIRGATPLHMVDAPTPGTGKGLLVEVCALPALGHSLPSMSAGRDDEEWRKRLTATLMRGDSHIHIDNITTALDSGVLASALTQDTWEDRLLGQTKTVRLLIRQIWAANGNNLVMSDEIARRSVWIRLDADHERPWERQGFRHKNIRGWALQQRPQLVAAALAMVKAWIDEDMPEYEERHKGSYESWGRILGGILHVNGIDGFLTNEEKLYEGKVNTNTAMAELVEAWYDRHGTDRVDSGELFKLASTPDEGMTLPHERERWLGLLDDLLSSGTERGRRNYFGKILNSYVDKVISGYKIINSGRSNGKTQYELSIIETAEPEDSSATSARDLLADIGL